MSFGDDTLDPDNYKISELNKNYPEANTREREWGLVAKDSDNPLALRTTGTKVLIRDDKFKTGYECKTCSGKGHTDEPCLNCKGTALEEQDKGDGEKVLYPCRACSVGASGARKSYGFKLCPSCNGRQATIIIPDENQRRPTTGTIISCGQLVRYYKIGDHVLFNNYTGSPFEIEGESLRVCKEDDVLSEVKFLKQEKGIEERKYKELEETGV